MLHIPELKEGKKRVVIIGGGFGGLHLARNLNTKYFQTVLIDKNNFHTFQPLLYQVSTAGLEPDSIAYPLRKRFTGKSDFFFRMAEVEHIDPQEKLISTNNGRLNYDYLVIATGTKSNFFGNKRIEKYAMPMKTVQEALDLRSLILQKLEKTTHTADGAEQDALLKFVIVGGGPTGVELAGALSELKNHVLPKDYPDLDLSHMHVYLLEAAPRLLGGMSETSANKALEYLKGMGVDVKLNTAVADYDGRTLELDGSDEEISAETLIWSAGVTGNTIKGISEDQVESNRYLVDDYNKIKGLDDIYAIGDIAMMKQENYPEGHPQVAPPAIQQGKLLAKNLENAAQNKAMTPFEYFDKGTMATIGRNKAVVDLGKLKFGGFMGWLAWMVVHLLSLVGFRNKIVTFWNWVWNYFSYDRGIRLIIRPFKEKRADKPKEKPEEALAESAPMAK